MPTPGPELLSMAQQFTGLPMTSLIGAPLMAAAKGNQRMALSQTQFMLDTCFNKTGTDPNVTYNPIMIQLTLIRSAITPGNAGSSGTSGSSAPTPPIVTPVHTTFNLPMLSIVPLNSLAVDTVDITFDMEVKSSYSEDQTDTNSNELQTAASFSAKVGFACWSAEVSGSVSYDHKDSQTHNTHYEKSNSAKYHVEVHASQLPLPSGVNIIIQAFANSITPIMVPAAGTAGTSSGT